MPERAAELLQACCIFCAVRYDDAEHDFVVTSEIFRRAVQDEVGAVLEGAVLDRCRGGRVDDHGRGMRDRSPQATGSSGTGSTVPRPRRGRLRRAAGRSDRQ